MAVKDLLEKKANNVQQVNANMDLDVLGPLKTERDQHKACTSVTPQTLSKELVEKITRLAKVQK